MDTRQRLLDGNELFRKAVDPTIMRHLCEKHEPWIAILACSDARSSPEKVFSLSLGDAFVVRVAGSSASDPKALASLEYAVEHLGVKTLLVLGHTDCGAAKAATSCEPDGPLEEISQDMRRARALTPSESQNVPEALAEGNVRLQLRMLQDNSCVIRDALRSERLSLIGAMLDLSTGRVRFI